MNQPINLVAFGTFGNPNGFKQTFFIFSEKDIARNIKTFDLKTDAITLFPKSKIYSIRKEFANGINALSYTIYTYAKEQNSDRGGTFIGSSILYLNGIAQENNTINCLNEFHNNLVLKNVQNDVIGVNHSDNFSVSKPKDFDQLNSQLKGVEDLNFGQSSNRNLVVYSQTGPDKLQQLFKKSIDLLNVYDSIYFTDSEEVAKYVNKKGIFKLVQVEGFEQEIQNLQEELKQKRQSSITEFEHEKQRVEVDRKRLVDEHTYQIVQNEKSHQENSRKIEESINELNQINQKYDDYLKQIDTLINRLKSGQKPDSVRQLLNENKRIFIESVNQQTQPKFITKISKRQSKTELRPSFQAKQSQNLEEEFSNHEHRQTRKRRSNFFKVLSGVLFILWLGTLFYFIIFNTTEGTLVETQSQPEQSKIQTVDQPKIDPITVKELTPKPNSELNDSDYKNVAKKISNNMTIKEIVKIIFDANPRDIGNRYSSQLEEYGKLIIEKNKDCFKEDSNKFFFLKDTLRHIPSYKK